MTRLDFGLLLTQSQYIDELLSKLDMLSLKPEPSPMVVGKKLSLSKGQPRQIHFLYRSTEGALQYLTHTRPDIAYVINHLS